MQFCVSKITAAYVPHTANRVFKKETSIGRKVYCPLCSKPVQRKVDKQTCRKQRTILFRSEQ